METKEEPRKSEEPVTTDTREDKTIPWEKYKWVRKICKGDIPCPRSGHSCVLVNEYELLLSGGCDVTRDLGDAYILDLRTMKWRRVWKLESGLGGNLVGHKSIILHKYGKFLNGYVLSFGGWDGRNYINKGYLYDTIFFDVLTSDSSFSKNAPPPRKDHTFTYSPFDEKAYVIGGWNPIEWTYQNTYFEDVWSLNSKWEWEKERLTGSPPCSRRAHSCIYTEIPSPCLVVFGGVSGYNKFLDDVYLLDLEKKKWIKAMTSGENPPPIGWHSANLIIDTMVVTCGMIGGEEYANEIFLLKIDTLIWTKLAISNPIDPRCSHTAINLGKSILILGGARQETSVERKEEEEKEREIEREHWSKGSATSESDMGGRLHFRERKYPFTEIFILEDETNSYRHTLEEIEAHKIEIEEDKEEFILNKFVIMEDLLEEKLSDEKKLNSEYYLSHLELSFQQPSIVPFDVRTTRSLDELKHNKAQAIKWSPKQFPGTADVIVERPTRRPTKAPDSTVTSVPFSGNSYVSRSNNKTFSPAPFSQAQPPTS